MAADEKSRYAENREILRKAAERLKRETDIDIDQLVSLVDEASEAYKVCRERIDAVEQLLKDRLPQPDNDAN